MFDIIRKQQLWDALDNGLHKELPPTSRFHLKTVQDLVVWFLLRETNDLSIAEVGGGASRLLQVLSKSNRCANIEKFDGTHGGPAAPVHLPGVMNYSTYLGEFCEDIPNESFDVVFSVSVIEHVPTERLNSFLMDGLRIMKPGGKFVHAIDIYVEDTPTPYWSNRFLAYRQWLTPAAGLEPIGDVYQGPLKFSSDMATNPDNIMYEWGQISPQFIDFRKRAQSVSIILAGRKPSRPDQ